MAIDDSSRMPFDSTRRNDGNLIKVTREIPLPWLIAAVIAFCGQAIALYYGQQSQGQQIATLTVDVKAATVKIDAIGNNRTEDMLKAMQLENKVDRHTEKLTALEDAIKKGTK